MATWPIAGHVTKAGKRKLGVLNEGETITRASLCFVSVSSVVELYIRVVPQGVSYDASIRPLCPPLSKKRYARLRVDGMGVKRLTQWA